MRRTSGILIFEQDEEFKENGEGFQGILVFNIPAPNGNNNCLVAEILPNKIKNIGVISLFRKKNLREAVLKLLLEKSPDSLEMGIPEIAIDTQLGYWYQNVGG